MWEEGRGIESFSPLIMNTDEADDTITMTRSATFTQSIDNGMKSKTKEKQHYYIYATDMWRLLWEDRAWLNLRREIDTLRRGVSHVRDDLLRGKLLALRAVHTKLDMMNIYCSVKYSFTDDDDDDDGNLINTLADRLPFNAPSSISSFPYEYTRGSSSWSSILINRVSYPWCRSDADMSLSNSIIRLARRCCSRCCVDPWWIVNVNFVGFIHVVSCSAINSVQELLF